MAKFFYSKILLFGEHIVVLGGQALAIPYPKLQAFLAYPSSNKPSINKEIKLSQASLGKLLKHCKQDVNIPSYMDIKQLESDCLNGLYCHSNIPQGYGLGSSGALIAALYHQYARKKSDNLGPNDLLLLQKQLANIESFFHGQSSGFDPLICYLNQAILKSDKGVKIVQLPALSEMTENIHFFLINTGIARKTGFLVQRFLEACQQADFAQLCQNELRVYNDQCIAALLQSDSLQLWQSMKQLSAFQLQYLTMLHPPNFAEKWQAGLASDDYYLKLCGAGGGGFMLGLTKNLNKVHKIWGERVLEVMVG